MSSRYDLVSLRNDLKTQRRTRTIESTRFSTNLMRPTLSSREGTSKQSSPLYQQVSKRLTSGSIDSIALLTGLQCVLKVIGGRTEREVNIYLQLHCFKSLSLQLLIEVMLMQGTRGGNGRTAGRH